MTISKLLVAIHVVRKISVVLCVCVRARANENDALLIRQNEHIRK